MSRRARRPTRRPGPTPRRPAPSQPIRRICRTSAPARTYRRRANASSRSTNRPAKRRTRRPGPTPRRPAPPRPIRHVFKMSAPARPPLRRASGSPSQVASRGADDRGGAAAGRAGTAAAFTAYTQNFSAGAHVAEPRKGLAALDEQTRKDADDKAGAAAERVGTAAAFTGYVQKFGSGAHVA